MWACSELLHGLASAFGGGGRLSDSQLSLLVDLVGNRVPVSQPVSALNSSKGMFGLGSGEWHTSPSLLADQS